MLLTFSLLSNLLLQVPALDAPRPPGRHDALDYHLALMLPDSGRMISGRATITWLLGSDSPLVVDLDSSLTVVEVTSMGRSLEWRRDGNTVVINQPWQPGDTITTSLAYRGDVVDGLIIQDRPDGRTYFADNWPNRARRWFPSHDHPADKATVTFEVEADARYRVIANGTLTGRETLPGNRSLWRYRQEQPLPTYSMVIGAAPMTVARLEDAACHVRCVPQTVWAFLGDSLQASRAFQPAEPIVEYFSELIAPFPYDGLAHVQSSTIFGGMENATAIFYNSGAYDDGPGERLIAHEIAHQWFGDAVTPSSWNHLWLSEGFATYFAALWLDQAHGPVAFRDEMNRTRNQIFGGAATRSPIVTDTLPPNLLTLLNTNNYGKGGWTLHMLRGVVGDRAFFDGVRLYYRSHLHRNASSADFQSAVEQAAGEDLDWFFRQALGQPGYPMLELSQDYDPAGQRLRVSFKQIQPAGWGTFRLPALALEFGGRREELDIAGAQSEVVFEGVPQDPGPVVVDPDGWWLLEVTRKSGQGR